MTYIFLILFAFFIVINTEECYQTNQFYDGAVNECLNCMEKCYSCETGDTCMSCNTELNRRDVNFVNGD